MLGVGGDEQTRGGDDGGGRKERRGALGRDTVTGWDRLHRNSRKERSRRSTCLIWHI